MKALLIKDFKCLKQQLFIYIIITITFIGLSSFIDHFVYNGLNLIFLNIGFLSIAMAAITISSINYDETTNSYPFLLTLPIDKKMYIIEKYIFGLILGILILVIIIALGSIYDVENIFGDYIALIYL